MILVLPVLPHLAYTFPAGSALQASGWVAIHEYVYYLYCTTVHAVCIHHDGNHVKGEVALTCHVTVHSTVTRRLSLARTLHTSNCSCYTQAPLNTHCNLKLAPQSQPCTVQRFT
jgi:hypothetical protein